MAGLIAENAKYEKGKIENEYDGMWSSSLTESLMREPDNQSVELSTRITALNELMDVTTKPLFLMLIMVEELSTCLTNKLIGRQGYQQSVLKIK